MSLHMQDMDKVRYGTEPQGQGIWSWTIKPVRRLIRTGRSILSPSMLNLELQTPSTVLKDYFGDWVIKSAQIGSTASLLSTLKVTAFKKPQPNIPVSLFLGKERVGYAKTDQSGLVTFPTMYTEPGVFDYVASIGEMYPPIIPGSPRAYNFRVGVWLVAVFCRDVSDIWLRWVGRSFFRDLPVYFWHPPPEGQPISVIGLGFPGLDRPIGFIDLVPCPSTVTIPMELGVSAWCNTTDPYPPPDVCCEAAKNTWWEMAVYATNDPRDTVQTAQGTANEKGKGNINLDYHLKFDITSEEVSYKGRYLKQQRCPWEAGTAPPG
mgnify:CR=1 FL=1